MDEFQKYLMEDYTNFNSVNKKPRSQPQPQQQLQQPQQPQLQQQHTQQPQLQQQQNINNIVKKKINWFKPTVCIIGLTLIIIVIVICATLTQVLKKIEMQMVYQQLTSQFKGYKCINY